MKFGCVWLFGSLVNARYEGPRLTYFQTPNRNVGFHFTVAPPRDTVYHVALAVEQREKFFAFEFTNHECLFSMYAKPMRMLLVLLSKHWIQPGEIEVLVASGMEDITGTSSACLSNVYLELK